MYTRQYALILNRTDVWFLKQIAFMAADAAGVNIHFRADFGLIRQQVTIEVRSNNQGSVDAYMDHFIIPMAPNPDFYKIKEVSERYANELKSYYDAQKASR